MLCFSKSEVHATSTTKTGLLNTKLSKTVRDSYIAVPSMPRVSAYDNNIYILSIYRLQGLLVDNKKCLFLITLLF